MSKKTMIIFVLTISAVVVLYTNRVKILRLYKYSFKCSTEYYDNNEVKWMKCTEKDFIQIFEGYLNGNTKAIVNLDKNGKKNGISKFFNEEGQIIIEEIYLLDSLTKRSEFTYDSLGKVDKIDVVTYNQKE